ncbi:MAG: outer membrane beta-barrel domain-containing protein [Persicimonas sp.]
MAAAAFACASLVGTTAFAEDDEAPDNPDVEERLDSYWSVDRDLQTVQERTYTREGRISAGLFAGLMSSEPFYFYLPVGARAGYHFSDQLAVEVEGSFVDAGFLTHNTDLTTFLEDRNDGDNKFDASTDTEDRFLWRSHAVVNWSPLYGKLAFLQRKLTHFDFNLSAGAGAVSVERPSEDRESASTTVVPEAVLGAGAQFFATPDLAIRADGRLYLYQGAKTPTSDTFFKRLKRPAEFLIGASYMF